MKMNVQARIASKKKLIQYGETEEQYLNDDGIIGGAEFFRNIFF